MWQTLTDKVPSQPLDLIRARWRDAREQDVGTLATEIAAWQTALWKFVPIGSYRYGNMTRQVANDPAAGDTQTLRFAIKPAPGQSEITLYLVTRDLGPAAKGHVVWHRPRFESAGKSPGKPALLLRDYAEYGPAYEVDYASVFADTAKYLAAAAAAAHDPKRSREELATTNGLDVAFLKRWIEVLALESLMKPAGADELRRVVPAVALERLDEKSPKNDHRPAINGWRRKGSDLPTLVTNASDKVQMIPGTLPPHKVAVHPTPKEFVAVAWNSPVAGSVRVTAKVTHAHPACGNGVAWWLEHRRADRASVLADGVLDLGGTVKPASQMLKVEKGDLLILAVDARNGDHSCDLTEIALTVTETEKPAQRGTWRPTSPTPSTPAIPMLTSTATRRSGASCGDRRSRSRRRRRWAPFRQVRFSVDGGRRPRSRDGRPRPSSSRSRFSRCSQGPVPPRRKTPTASFTTTSQHPTVPC